jgi:hypothetical protein
MARVLHRAAVRGGACALEALEQGFTHFLAQWPDAIPRDARVLRLSVREGCTNAFRHGSNRAGDEGRIEMELLHDDAGEPPGLRLEITDQGPGVSVDGALPPYPDSFAGSEFMLRRVLDQLVVARVVSPWRIELRGEETPCAAASVRREDLLGQLHGGGYGILMLCRCWSRVSFTLEPGRGNVLRLAGMCANLDC